MSNALNPAIRPLRARIVAAMLLLALTSLAWSAAPAVAQDASAAPEASPSSAEAACSSASDLSLIIGFIGDRVEEEAGLIPVGIGVIAGVSEAQELVGLVAEVYRPLVQDLVVSLQDLRDTLGDLGDESSAGAKLAAVGESITGIGNSMDELGQQLRAGCDDL